MCVTTSFLLCHVDKNHTTKNVTLHYTLVPENKSANNHKNIKQVSLKRLNSLYVLAEDCTSHKVVSDSMAVGRKCCVSAPDLITQPSKWGALHSNQVTGTPNSRPDSFLNPPSFQSATLPFLLSLCRHLLILELSVSYCRWSHLCAHAQAKCTCLRGFQAGSGGKGWRACKRILSNTGPELS